MLYFPCRMDWGKDPLTLSNPSADLEPKGLQDPGYPLTTHNQVKATNVKAPAHLCRSKQLKTVSIDARSLHVGLLVTIELPSQGGKLGRTTLTILPGLLLEIQLKDTVITLLVDGNKQQL